MILGRERECRRFAHCVENFIIIIAPDRYVRMGQVRNHRNQHAIVRFGVAKLRVHNLELFLQPHRFIAVGRALLLCTQGFALGDELAALDVNGEQQIHVAYHATVHAVLLDFIGAFPDVGDVQHISRGVS